MVLMVFTEKDELMHHNSRTTLDRFKHFKYKWLVVMQKGTKTSIG